MIKTATPPTLDGRLALDRKAAAAALGVSTSTIARAVAAGHLKAKKTESRGGKQLYAVADLVAWFDGLEDA